MDQKLLLSPEEGSAAIGVKRSTFFKMLASGTIPSIKVGRLRKVPVQSLRDWVSRQLAEQVGEEGDSHGQT